ncbi:MAG: hypothetical protein AVDCRST_MAG79-2825, partial [uncultured Thermoleophilia bacterium]
VPSRRPRGVRRRARAEPEARVRDGLRTVPVLRADAGGDLSLQQARSQDRASAVLSALPPDDGGRLGLGQEPAVADHPARRRPHHPGSDDRGAQAGREHPDDAPRRLRRAARRGV